ncbi:hypothetical protein D1871_14045 [Nakamurella silvestris]|nr:hypothetical protein D1871_14045 [Nakamurella silvestris]
MTDLTSDATAGRPDGGLTAAQVAAAERQLMLVDRIQVLQNELAEWRVRDQMSHQRLARELNAVQDRLNHAQAENAALRAAVNEVHSSMSWRIGRTVLLPVRAAKWARRRRGRTA